MSKACSHIRRKRHVTIHNCQGYQYLEDNFEKIAQGLWSTIESLLLHNILTFTQKRNGRHLTVNAATVMYNKPAY